jgi:queuine tRNA-ribosyltransferase accessory subunit
MKFALNTVSKLSGRCGVLSAFEKFPDKCLQTPLLLLYTRVSFCLSVLYHLHDGLTLLMFWILQGASVPYLSREVLDYLTSEFQALCMPLQGTEHMEVAAKAFGQDIQTFAGLDRVGVSFVTLKDAAEVSQSSLHENNSVPFFTRHGKVQMTVERFMDVVGAFHPDFYQVLGDADTNQASGKKRLASATQRTEEFFVACLEKHRKSEALQKVRLFATVAGGYSLPLREKSAKFYDEYKEEISGYVIDGLHSNGPEVSVLDRKTVTEVVGHTNSFLPEDKMRVMLGAYNPLMVLELVSLGVDAFDSSYVYLCSKQNRALTFSFNSADGLSEETTFHLDMSDVK